MRKRRFASHFIYCGGVHRMAYVELDEQNRFLGIYPLTGEIAGTAFYDGILLPLVADEVLVSSETRLASWLRNTVCSTKEQVFDFLAETGLAGGLETGMPVVVYRLGGIGLAGNLQTSPELGADHSRGNGYIERL